MAKNRSPNYPAHDLGAAVEYARRIYKAEGKSSATSQVLANALGHSDLSGAARQKIAAMKQFGLLLDTAGDKMQLSGRGLKVANMQPTDAGYRDVIRETALAPALFREFQENPEASDRNIEVNLTTVKGFSPDGARRVIKSYRDTLAFAKLDGGGYDEPAEQADDEAKRRTDGLQPPAKKLDVGHDDGAHPLSLGFILPQGVKAEVTFDLSGGNLTRRTVQRLREYLALLEEDLAPEEPITAPEPARSSHRDKFPVDPN